MAGKFGKYLGAAMTTPGKTLNKVADVTASATVGTAKFANKAMPLTRKTDPAFHNLWTGHREGRGLLAGAVLVGGAYTGYESMKQTALAPKLGEVSYGGVAPIMNADGVSTANQAPTGGSAPTLGANGNMVFGLHNARKG